MDITQRNPWQGLTARQAQELDEAVKHPHRAGRYGPDTYQNAAQEYAIRAAALLVNNDLRGAMNAAEISTAAAAIGQRLEEGNRDAAERWERFKEQEANDPKGRLVHVKGKRRMVRVMPGEEPPTE